MEAVEAEQETTEATEAGNGGGESRCSLGGRTYQPGEEFYDGCQKVRKRNVSRLYTGISCIQCIPDSLSE